MKMHWKTFQSLGGGQALLVLALIAPHWEAIAAETWMTTKHQAVLDYLRDEDAATVKDAIWLLQDSLKIGVLDNGSPRHGYAEYVCAVVNEQGLHGVNVHVVDIVKLKRDGDWTPIGKARCK